MKNILKNKIEQKEYKSTKKYTCTIKKRKRLFEKGLKKIAQMQNLSQNELKQIAEIRDQSRDELERIANIRRIKNYEEISREKFKIKTKHSRTL